MLSLRTRLNVLTEVSDYEESGNNAQMSPEEEDAKQRRKREKKRRKIIRELFESEKGYLHHLELIHKHFDFPLRFACIIPEDVHGKLFSNLEQILEVNRQLLEELEHSSVGLAFLHLGPFLKLYSTYANDHEQAIATLQEWLHKNAEFAKFISIQEGRPEVRGLKLNALLITPVQRVPRYQMLLEDLLEHTSPEHHDYNDLAEATKKIREVAWHINEHIRQHENFQKMLDIQNRLSGSAPKILAPGRLFIKEGCLKKVCKGKGRALDRMFFLFSDMLLYAKPRLLDSGKNTYTCSCVLPLKHCKIEPVFGKPRKGQEGGMFRIICQNESLLLYSTQPGVVNEWTEELLIAIRRFNKNRRTLRKPSSNMTPIRGNVRLLPKKTDTPTQKRPLEAVAEENMDSPCFKDSLHPMRLQMTALRDLDLTNCMSPRKRARKEVPECELPIESIDQANSPPFKRKSSSKLSETLGSMELTEDSLTADPMDLSMDFLADHSDRVIQPRPPLHSYNQPDCDARSVYSHLKHGARHAPPALGVAVEGCFEGLKTAHDHLKSPVTSRCVIL